MLIPRAEFHSLCTAADNETLVCFVAGLYEARGRDVERAGPDRLDVSTSDGTRRVAVLDRAAWSGRVPDGADTAVVGASVETRATADTPDTPQRVTDAGDLHEQLSYAVDRSDAAALLERHFDHPVDPAAGPDGRDEPEPPAPQPSDNPEIANGEATDRSSSGSDESVHADAVTAAGRETGGGGYPAWARVGARPVVAAVVVGFVLVGGVAVALVPPGGGTVGPNGGQPAATPVSPTGADAGNGPAGSTSPTTERAPVATTPAGCCNQPAPPPSAQSERPTQFRTDVTPGQPFPAGTGTDGITDERRLVEAHRSILANQSYELTITYRELAEAGTGGLYTERIRVESDSRYRVTTDSIGDLQTVPNEVSGRDWFANGSVRLERTDSGVRTEPVEPGDPFLEDVARYMRWYLSVRDSSIASVGTRAGEPLYRIVTIGDPYPGVRDATGTAFVTGRGLVLDLRRVHTQESQDVRVVIRMRTDGVGSTNVSRPAWAGNP
ncbi:MAG: hypothetical protein ABEH56_04670 [Salinirussus sp.]